MPVISTRNLRLIMLYVQLIASLGRRTALFYASPFERIWSVTTISNVLLEFIWFVARWLVLLESSFPDELFFTNHTGT